MTKYAEAAKRFIEIYHYLKENSIPVPETEFTSNIGEWLVMDQLVELGYSSTLQSGQYDVDILLDKEETVEVKSGTWDSDLGGVYRFDRIKPEKLDYLVCVKFEDDYADWEFFVFSEDDVYSLPPRNNAAFNDPEREGNQRLLRILDDIDRATKDETKEINKDLAEYRNSWHKLTPP